MSIPIDAGEEACVIQTGDLPTFGFDLDATIARLEDERWALPMQSLTHSLPFAYDRLPWPVRALGAVAALSPQRVLRGRQTPPWPVAPSLDVLRALRGDAPSCPWSGRQWGFSLTCDVDSPAGWRRASKLADAVEAAGFRAAFFVVGELLEAEPAIAEELAARGHEIGSHDLRHDNRLITLDEEALTARLTAARASIEPYGGVGFRSPSLLRSPRLLRAILRSFEYDTSLCDTDLEFGRGATTVCPYPLGQGVELPVTLPMDSSLRFTLHGAGAIATLWREKCGWIREVGGLATLAIHAEPQLSGGARFRGVVIDFLTWIREQDDVEVLLPREVAERVDCGTRGGPGGVQSDAQGHEG